MPARSGTGDRLLKSLESIPHRATSDTDVRDITDDVLRMTITDNGQDSSRSLDKGLAEDFVNVLSAASAISSLKSDASLPTASKTARNPRWSVESQNPKGDRMTQRHLDNLDGLEVDVQAIQKDLAGAEKSVRSYMELKDRLSRIKYGLDRASRLDPRVKERRAAVRSLHDELHSKLDKWKDVIRLDDVFDTSPFFSSQSRL